MKQAEQAEQVEQINIKNGNSQVEVSLIGGTPVKFVHIGTNIIYPQRILKIGGEMKKRGGIPVCFPFFGPPKGFKGLDQHGWLRNQKLDVLEISDKSVVFKGENQYREIYPWRMKYKLIVSIVKDGSLKTELRVIRMKDGVAGNAPINPGFHPYLANSFGYKTGAVDTSGSDSPFGAEIKVHPDGNPRIFRATDDILIDLGLKKVRMSLGGDFTKEARLVLWSDSQDYFCVEPVLANPDGFNTQSGRYLEEEESLTLICLLEVM